MTLKGINASEYKRNWVAEMQPNWLMVLNSNWDVEAPSGKKFVWDGSGLSNIQAQTFVFGDWSDWDLIITSWTTNLNLNQAYQFSSINIASGATLSTTDTNWNMLIKCNWDVQIDWDIDLNGKSYLDFKSLFWIEISWWIWWTAWRWWYWWTVDGGDGTGEWWHSYMVYTNYYSKDWGQWSWWGWWGAVDEDEHSNWGIGTLTTGGNWWSVSDATWWKGGDPGERWLAWWGLVLNCKNIELNGNIYLNWEDWWNWENGTNWTRSSTYETNAGGWWGGWGSGWWGGWFFILFTPKDITLSNIYVNWGNWWIGGLWWQWTAGSDSNWDNWWDWQAGANGNIKFINVNKLF